MPININLVEYDTHRSGMFDGKVREMNYSICYVTLKSADEKVCIWLRQRKILLMLLMQ